MKLVFAHTVEGLFYKALAGQVSPALKADVLAIGLDLDQKPRDLAHETWVKVLGAAVRHLYPRLSIDDGYYRLGEAIMQGYEHTLMGKTLFAMMRLLGPKRVLARASTNLRSGNTYSEATVKQLGANQFEVWTNECNGNPNYLRAIFFGALHRAGAKSLQVKVLNFDGRAATFDVSWS